MMPMRTWRYTSTPAAQLSKQMLSNLFWVELNRIGAAINIISVFSQLQSGAKKFILPVIAFCRMFGSSAKLIIWLIAFQGKKKFAETLPDL